MEENLHNDNLEEFFRKSLEDFEDEPSEMVWENIAVNIPPKPETKTVYLSNNWKRYLSVAALLALLLGASWIWYAQRSQIETLSNELGKTQNQVSTLDAKIDSLKNEQAIPSDKALVQSDDGSEHQTEKKQEEDGEIAVVNTGIDTNQIKATSASPIKDEHHLIDKAKVKESSKTANAVAQRMTNSSRNTRKNQQVNTQINNSKQVNIPNNLLSNTMATNDVEKNVPQAKNQQEDTPLIDKNNLSEEMTTPSSSSSFVEHYIAGKEEQEKRSNQIVLNRESNKVEEINNVPPTNIVDVPQNVIEPIQPSNLVKENELIEPNQNEKDLAIEDVNSKQGEGVHLLKPQIEDKVIDDAPKVVDNEKNQDKESLEKIKELKESTKTEEDVVLVPLDIDNDYLLIENKLDLASANSEAEQKLSKVKQKKPKVRKLKKQRWMLGTYTSLVFTKQDFEKRSRRKRHMTRPNPEPSPHNSSILNNRKGIKTSYKTGVDLGYRLNNRFSLRTGIGYQQNRQRNVQKVAYKYKPSDSVNNNDGSINSNYKYTLTTSYGDIEVESRLENDRNSRRDCDELDILVNTETNLHFVSIPLSLQYQILSPTSRFNIGVNAGVSMDWLIHSSLDIHAQEAINGNELRLDSKLSKNDKRKFDGLSENTWNWLAGVEFSYVATPNLSLVFSPTYSRNINPIHTFKTRGREHRYEDFQTHLEAVNVKFGINYHF